MAYNSNIESETLENDDYRRVLFTGEEMQLAVMNLRPGDDIPPEVHEDVDQFIRVESGNAEVTVEGEEFKLKKDDVIIIPAGSEHYVKNAGTDNLKLYTIYSPPEHPEGTVHETQEDASLEKEIEPFEEEI